MEYIFRMSSCINFRFFKFSGVIILFSISAATAQSIQNTVYTFQYDKIGNLTQITDPLSNITIRSYDALSRLKQQIRPVPASGVARPVTNFTYDGLDQVNTVVDPRSLTTTYTNDGLGNQSTLASPDTGATNRTFDEAGNVRTSTDSRGKVTTYSYDVLNRITKVAYATGTATQFEYDGGAAGAPYAIGHLTKMTDESGQTTYAYDQMGRLLTKTQTTISSAGTQTKTVSYAYGSNGRLISMTYPTGSRVNYSYDAAGNVSSITLNPSDGNGGTDTGNATALLSQISYVPFGSAQSWVWGNSTDAVPNAYARTFDLDGRMTSYPLGNPTINSQGVIRTVSYDAASQVTGYSHTGGATASSYDQTFGYDGLGRLISFVNATSSQTFGYDASGNRIRLSIGGTSYTNTIATASNRLTAASGPLPAKVNVIDSAGNLTSDGTTSFIYSDRGRLQSATKAGLSTTYLYNGIGQRVSKTGTALGSGENEFLYDEAGRLIGEYDGAGNAIQETIWLDGAPIVVLKPSTTQSGTYAPLVYYVYADHLATPRVIADSASGAVVWSWVDADPFGMTQPSEAPSGGASFAFNIRFPGQYFDRETGLHYNYFRNYDPQTGRYVQSDPIGLAGGVNTYAYVDAQPTMQTDPMGLAPGDPYPTPNAAAIQAIKDVNPMSIKIDLEIGGRVYRRTDGRYSYTWPAMGTQKDMGQIPAMCENNEGIYHTHGNYNGRSRPDIISGMDQYWSDKESKPIWAGTPSGNILKFTPNGIPYGGPVEIVARGVK